MPVDTFTIEAISLYWPLCLFLTLFLVFREKIKARHFIAAMMSSTWLAATVPIINSICIHYGLWFYQIPHNIQLLGIPVSLYVGWIVFWGILPALLFSVLKGYHFIFICILLGIVDLLTMPLIFPVLTLKKYWLVGEFFLILFTLIPSLLITQWVIEYKNPGYRSFFISLAFVLLILIILPSSHSLFAFSPYTTWQSYSILEKYLSAISITLFAIPGIAAVQEFAIVGRGTPIPQDPPKQLVTTGVYSFCSNPIQFSMISVITLWSIIFSPYYLIIALIGFIYSIGIAKWSEKSEMMAKYGIKWKNYRNNVSCWAFRKHPTWSQTRQAEIFIDHQCNTCKPIGEWLTKHSPKGLEIKNSSDWTSSKLKRITYHDPNTQHTWSGVQAFARALQHLDIRFALLGWFIAIPPIAFFIQAAMDASGTAPAPD